MFKSIKITKDKTEKLFQKGKTEKLFQIERGE